MLRVGAAGAAWLGVYAHGQWFVEFRLAKQVSLVKVIVREPIGDSIVDAMNVLEPRVDVQRGTHITN